MPIPERLRSDRRYVLSLRKTGLGDRFICLGAAWKFAKNTGRTLVVDWRHSIYTNDSQDLFSVCFEPLSDLAGVPILTSEAIDPAILPRPVYPAPWQDSALLDRPWLVPADAFPAERERGVELIRSGGDVDEPTVIFNSCINDGITSFTDARQFFEGLRPTLTVREAVDRFCYESFGGSPFIGLHVRHGNGGDIMGHATSWSSPPTALERCRRAIEKARERLGRDIRVFLSTDSADVEQALRILVPGVVVRAKSFRGRGEGELHFGGGVSHLQEALVEMFTLTRSSALIRYPAGSFFSLYAAVMKSSQGPQPASISDLLQASDPRDALSPAILF